MLAYAPRPERRRFSPGALALIAGAHAIAILSVMTARMALPEKHREPPLVIDTIKVPPEPRPVDEPRDRPRPADQSLDAPTPIHPPLVSPGPIVEPLLPPPNPGPIIGSGVAPRPVPDPPLVRTGPRFATPEGDIRPPYPEAKRALEQEATLRLRLTIDERGRVTAVEPVGVADPAFLAAARRHIVRSWRYRPAMEGDKAIASSTVITLKFELD